VAKRFAGNPYIVGYDPLNEPFPSNIYADPTLFLEPGKFDRVALQPLFNRTFVEAYQPADSSKIMFFEPTQFPDTMGILGGIVWNLGFTKPPGAENGSPVHVLNDHTYCCQLDPAVCATGEPNPSYKDACQDWHDKRLATRDEDAQRLGVPLFISEFGACLNSSVCVQEINQVADACDEHLAGWAYWQMKNFADLTTSAGTGSEGFYNNDGSLQDEKVKALARSYLQATQGVIKTMKFYTTNRFFHAMF
jgi:endoglycosylceramidase